MALWYQCPNLNKVYSLKAIATILATHFNHGKIHSEVISTDSYRKV